MSAHHQMRPRFVCCGCLQSASHGLGAAALGLGRGEGRQADKVMMGISAQEGMLLESPSGELRRRGTDEGCHRAVQGRQDTEVEIHRLIDRQVDA